MTGRRSPGDPRITWVRGTLGAGPHETIGVLEVRGDGRARAVFSERAEVVGRAHVLLARHAWGPKDSRETRWWSLVMDGLGRVATVRNGSCGDALGETDVRRIVAALEELGLLSTDTMVAVDGGPPVFPGRAVRSAIATPRGRGRSARAR